jgi:hypothetical protein
MEDYPLAGSDRRIEEEAMHRQIPSLERKTSPDDLLKYGGFTPEQYDGTLLDTRDKYWVLMHTQLNKLLVRGVLDVVDGVTDIDQLSHKQAHTLVAMISPLTLGGMAPTESVYSQMVDDLFEHDDRSQARG